MTVNFGRYSPSSVRELTLDTPPRGRVNYVTNPSLEGAVTTSWASVQPTIEASTEYSLFGSRSLKIVTASTPTNSSIATNTLNVPKIGTYTFSVYVYVAGATLEGRTITITAESGNATYSLVESRPGTLVNSSWVRCSATYNVTALGQTLANVGSLTFVMRLSGTLATAGSQAIYFDGALCERSATADGYFDGTLYANGTTVEPRWNMIGNGSIEENTTGWSVAATSVPVTLAVNTARKYIGASCMSMTGGGGGEAIVQFANTPVVAGARYTFSAWVQGNGPCSVRLVWLTSALSVISTSTGSSSSANNTEWTQRSVTATAPATAAFVNAQFYTSVMSTGVVFYLDAALLERSQDVNEFIDRETYANNIVGTTSWGPTTNNTISLVEYVSTNTDWAIAPTFTAGNGIGSIVPQSVSVTGTNSRVLVNPTGNVSFINSSQVALDGVFSDTFSEYLIVVNLRLSNFYSYSGNYESGPAQLSYSSQIGIVFNLRSDQTNVSSTTYDNQRLDSIRVATRTVGQREVANSYTSFLAPIVYRVSKPVQINKTPITRLSVEYLADDSYNKHALNPNDPGNTVVVSNQNQSVSFNGFSLQQNAGDPFSGNIQVYGIEA